MATLAKSILICYDYIPSTQDYYFNFDPYVNGWTATYINGPLPSGITAITNPNNGSTIGLSVDDNLGNGTVTINLVVFNTDDTVYDYFDYQITRGECIAELPICCGEDAAIIRWLGVNGAINQWTFPGVREFEIKLGDANTFKSIEKVQFYSDRKNIFHVKRVSSGLISRDDVGYLSELRYSIQCWEWLDGWQPIVVANDSFPLFKSRQKFFDVSITYNVAKELSIQTQ